MMKFNPAALFVFFVTLFSTLVSALPVSVRDVYVPPVTFPTAGVVWKVGSAQNVTWDTSNPPTQITNPIGRIVLSKGGLLNLTNPLAEGFDILLGSFEVTVPDVEPADDYAIVLFGDSGNASPEFTITN